MLGDCLVAAFGSPVAATPPTARSRAGLRTEVTIAIRDGYYDPCALTLPANTPVAVTLVNDDSAIGRFQIDELGIQTDVLQPGESRRFEIDAPPGYYVYYSDLPGHPEAGVAGVLTVVGPPATPVAATPSSSTPNA